MPGPNTPYTQLDQQQILQQAFDETTDRLRVDAELTASIIPAPGLEVNIQAVDDNIAIRNSNNSNELLINSDGSINVTSVISGNPNINLHQVGGVATAVNNGIASAGTQRVVIASDNTPFIVNAAQSGIWSTGRTWVLDSSTDSVAISNFPGSLSVTQGTSPWVVSGTVTANAGTGNFTVVQATASNLNVAVGNASGASAVNIQDGGNSITVDGTVAATQSGAWSTGRTWTLASGTDSVAAVQSGTWTVQPGNTANTTAWLVTGTGGTFPVTDSGGSLTVDNNGTFAVQSSISGNLPLQSGSAATASLSGAGTATFDCTGVNTVTLEILSGWTGSINLFQSSDGVDFTATAYAQEMQVLDGNLYNVITGATWGAVTSLWKFDTSGIKSLKFVGVNIVGPALLKIYGSQGQGIISGILNTVFVSGNVSASQSGTWTVQPGNTANTTPWLVTNSATVAQNSTTSGQTGELIQGAVTTNAPTYTTAKTDPLSLDTSGNLRVSLKDSPANTNKFLVTADPITFASPQHIIADASSAVIGHVITDSGSVTTATLSAETTKVIGTVNQGTSPWVTNISQINGVIPLMGNGTTGTGSQRVTIASDNTAFSVNATLQAGAATIGAVTQASGPWTNNLTQVGGSSVTLGQATAANSIPVTLSNENVQDLYFTGQSAQTVTVNNIISASSGTAATDVLGYRSGSIQVVSTGTGGTFIFEGSNDNTNFQTIPVYSQLILTGTPITAAITASNSNLIYTFPLNVRYIRLRIASTITGGSIQAFARFTQTSWSPAVVQIAQSTAANLNVTTPSNSSINLSQVAGNSTSTGNGTSSTGTLRVAVCSNNTAFNIIPNDGTNPIFTAAAALADAKSNPTEGRVAVDNNLFNGTSWDRARNNQDTGVALDSFTKVTSAAGGTFTNYNARGAIFTIVTSSVSGSSPTLTAQLQYSYDAGTTWVSIPGAVTATITGNATNTLMVYPGIAVSANAAVSAILPRIWRFTYTIGGSSPSFVINTYAAYVI